MFTELRKTSGLRIGKRCLRPLQAVPSELAHTDLNGISRTVDSAANLLHHSMLARTFHKVKLAIALSHQLIWFMLRNWAWHCAPRAWYSRARSGCERARARRPALNKKNGPGLETKLADPLTQIGTGNSNGLDAPFGYVFKFHLTILSAILMSTPSKVYIESTRWKISNIMSQKGRRTPSSSAIRIAQNHITRNFTQGVGA